MSEEDLELLITVDAPEYGPEEDTLHLRKKEETPLRNTDHIASAIAATSEQFEQN